MCEQPDPSDPAYLLQLNAVSDSTTPVSRALFLVEDGSTRCWHSAVHVRTVTFVLLTLLFYSVGWPLLCFVFLMRTFGSEHTQGHAGWMWCRYKLLRGPAPAHAPLSADTV